MRNDNRENGPCKCEGGESKATGQAEGVTMRGTIQVFRSRIMLVSLPTDHQLLPEKNLPLPLSPSVCHLLSTSCGYTLAFIVERKKKDLAGEDSLLFSVRAELREAYRYIH